MAAVLWGLLDGETTDAIIRRLYVEKSVPYTEAQPFFTSVVLRALDRAGRFDLAMGIVRERWGRRMADRGATSAYEEWTTNGSWRSGTFAPIMRTLSHAWSAFPAEFLIRYLGGIEIVEPGCGKVRVAPRDAGFDYALTYPTPKGPIVVRRRGGEAEVSVPDGVEVVGD